MIARFALPDGLCAHEDLIGMMQGISSDGDTLDDPCMLRRRAAQA